MEEALDLSFDRLLMMMMNVKKFYVRALDEVLIKRYLLVPRIEQNI